MGVVPPTFSDLGKVAKEVFNKGFSIGSNKLTVKTKTAAGISLSPSFELKNDNLCAAFETSGSPAPGFTLKEKWCSGNVTKTNLVVEDKLAKGLKLDLEVVVNAVTEYSGVQGGAEVGFDTEKSKLTKDTLALGYTNKDLTFVGFIKDLSVFEGLVHHKVCPDTEVAASLSYNKGTNACAFNFGTNTTLSVTH